MLKKIILAVILLLWCLPAFAEKLPFIGIATEEGVNIRSGPNTNFESMYQTAKGGKLVVLAKSYNWYKIKLPGEAVCYISSQFVEPFKQEPAVNPENPADFSAGVVTANRVNIRARPGEKYTILGQADKGQVISIVSKRDGWYAIRPLDNCYGWIHEKFVKFDSVYNAAQAENILRKENIVLKKSVPETIAPQPPVAPPAVVARSQKPDKVELIGVIEPRGKVVGRQGTHKLMINKRVAYYLQGEPVVLDNYIHFRVKVIGEKREAPSSDLPVIKVERITAE